MVLCVSSDVPPVRMVIVPKRNITVKGAASVLQNYETSM